MSKNTDVPQQDRPFKKASAPWVCPHREGTRRWEDGQVQGKLIEAVYKGHVSLSLYTPVLGTFCAVEHLSFLPLDMWTKVWDAP